MRCSCHVEFRCPRRLRWRLLLSVFLFCLLHQSKGIRQELPRSDEDLFELVKDVRSLKLPPVTKRGGNLTWRWGDDDRWHLFYTGSTRAERDSVSSWRSAEEIRPVPSELRSVGEVRVVRWIGLALVTLVWPPA